MSTAVAAERWWDSDLAYNFRHSPVAVGALIVTVALIILAVGADFIAPVNVMDPGAANVIDARLPPGSSGMIGGTYLFGTDPQGRDMLSTVIYGLRTSILVGGLSVVIAMSLGVALGLAAGYYGGWFDGLIMRIADVQLSFPSILVALLIDGVSRTVMNRAAHDALATTVLIVAIAASFWVQYARSVRGLVLVERDKDYVAAARIIGLSPLRIIWQHVRPNVMGPVLVIATINLALAILTESTLSFLGVGVPPTTPSLGSLVRIGNEFLFSGDWWISVIPGAALVLLSLAVNLLGDWLRDALNPRISS